MRSTSARLTATLAMKSWSKTLTLTEPPHDVRALPSRRVGEGAEPPNAGREAALREQLEESYQRGRIEAERMLSEQLVQQRAELQDVVNGLIVSLREAVPQVFRQSEQAVTELAFEIAQKVMGVLPVTADMVSAVVREALAEVEGGTELSVRLNPSDLELLEKMSSPVLQSPDCGRKVKFVSSPEVARGGCLVYTNFGVLDARRDSKFELLKQTLLG